MPNQNQPENPGLDNEAAIEEHVKQMMEPGLPDPEPTKPASARKPGGASEVKLSDLSEGATKIKVLSGRAKSDQVETASLDNPEMDKVVEEITKAESDELLDAEDQGHQQFIMKPSRWSRLKDSWASWWGNPTKRYSSLGAIVAIFVILGVVPVTRYFVLNTVGVRSHASVQVLDKTTSLPLKGVSVTLAGHQATTSATGRAEFSHIRLGEQDLKIHKLAFADYTTTVTIGMGGLNVPSIKLKAVGSQFEFKLTDYLSGKGVSGAEVTSGSAYAQSGASGKAVLTVQPADGSALPIHISATGYRSTDFKIDPTINGTHGIQLVAAGKDVFVSKSTGKYDLYSSDIDGKNRKLILPATGHENRNMSLSISPNNRKVAFVSTRDDQRDAGGYLLSTLTVLGTDGADVHTLDHSEQISLLGWAGGRLIYEKVAAGASAANPARERIMSYDPVSGQNLQLASANNFDGLVVIGNGVYYATPGTNRTHGLFARVSSTGSDRQTILSVPVWTLLRTGYDTLSLQTASGWTNYSVESGLAASAAAPAAYASRQYSISPDGSHSLWIDSRDGKGTLLNYNPSTGKSTTVTARTGLGEILGWVNNHTAIYRVTNSQETADYVVDLSGGKPKKITNVTDVQSAY